MTTRVQKGGASFRPVARPKGKARDTSSVSASALVRSSAPPSQANDARKTPSASVAPTPAPVPAASSSNTAVSTSFEDIAELLATPSAPTVSSESSRQWAPPAISSGGSASAIRISTPSTNTFNPSSFQSNQASQSASTLIAPPTMRYPSTSQPEKSTLDLPDDDDLPPMPPPAPPALEMSESASTAPARRAKSAQIAKPRRTRKKSDAEQSEGEDTEARPRKRARRSTTEEAAASEAGHSVSTRRKTRGRKSRASSPPDNPLSSIAEPGEDLDPTVVKMSDLCEDTGQGRVSSKVGVVMESHVAWKARNREKRAHKIMEMELRKLGKNAEADEVGAPVESASAVDSASTMAQTSSAPPEVQNGDADDSEDAAVIDESGQGFDYSQMFQTNQTTASVRVRIGPNGETIIDEQSLVVDREDGNDDTSNYTRVNESDHTKFTNSATYQRKGGRGQRWSAEETEFFYDALSQFGENYEMISIMLPGRDRTACKNKFKAEDKKNPARITDYLKNRIPIDMKTLEQRTGKDFSGPTPVIKMPQRIQPATPAQVKERRHTSPPRANPARKRSRSRTAGPEDGVEVLGSIDDVPMPED